MTKIKVSSLQPGPQMNALVARARGWKLRKGMSEAYDVWRCGEFDNDIFVDDYNPSGNSGQAMELLKEFDYIVGFAYEEHDGAKVYSCQYGRFTPDREYGYTPEIAICKAVIADHFGDKVEVEEQ